MRINKKNSSKKKKIAIVLFVTILIGIGGYFLYQNYIKENQSAMTDSDSENSPKKRNNTSTKSDSTSDPKLKAPTNNSPNVDTSKTSNEVPISTAISAEISQLTQTEGVVSYSASISGSQTGTCSALFTNPIGKPVTKVTETSNGICKSDVPAQEFDALGEWTLQLSFYADNTQATASKNIIIN